MATMVNKTLIVSVAFVTVCFLGWTPVSAKPKPSVYKVAKVSVSADAKDAVSAKQKALDMAQQEALHILLKRLTPWSLHTRLPVLNNSLVERMITGFAVRREGTSATRYMATLDFTFEPNSVRNLLNRFNLSYADQQAPQTLLLPVMLEAGGMRSGTNNVWYSALSSVDGENSLTPVKLASPRQDFSLKMIDDLSEHSRELFETLKYQYRAENLVLAVAETDPQITQMKVLIVGHDAVGDFKLARTYRIYDRDVDETANMAAEIALKVIEGRWKTTRLASLGALSGPAELQAVELTVQFSGLAQWKDIRGRLNNLPGLQALDVKALNARGATVTLDFPGGTERLAQAVKSEGMTMEQYRGGWVLMVR